MSVRPSAVRRFLLAGLFLAASAAGVRAETSGGVPVGTWAYAGKTGIGTSWAPYGPERARSRVWFSLARGVLTETMWPLIHDAQLRELSFAVSGDGFTAFEDGDVDTRVDYLKTDARGRPQALAYRIVNTDRRGRFRIEKQVFTDPAGDALMMRITVTSLGPALTPHLLADPQMHSTSGGDRAEADARRLHAWDGDAHMVIAADAPFASPSAGIAGATDGWTSLRRDGRLIPRAAAGEGDVTLAADLAPVPAGGSRTYDVALGFGADRSAAQAAAAAALRRGAAAVRADYEASWARYLAGLSELPRVASVSGDGGRLAYASAMVLKAQEDKSNPGALIASLSFPWGDTVSASRLETGYKAVWPRDFYQVASALMALGDRDTPVRALDYLRTVQVLPGRPGASGATGWFLQKTHVDGQPEWVGVQMDQTAMPIMLADKLWRAGWVDDAHVRELYAASLKPAADFLASGGHVRFLTNDGEVVPPWTQQERWEEQSGFSPSTTAAEISGLVAAADIARGVGDTAGAARDLAAADAESKTVEARSFTAHGVYGDGRYFVRISPDGAPDGPGRIPARNGKPSGEQQRYLDAGFLELVRYGVRRADAPSIVSTLPKLDDQTLPDAWRVRYDFRFPGEDGTHPGWRRYSDDGYGEDTKTGAGFGPLAAGGRDTPDQRGRVWPIFTGERGHYEIARATLNGPLSDADRTRIRDTYARTMELFANTGLMIPEQVYDGVGASGGTEPPGQGTGSATPLSWSHAEYVKLLRSLADGRVWDRYDAVAQRYAR